jgi:hypothetical protein
MAKEKKQIAWRIKQEQFPNSLLKFATACEVEPIYEGEKLDGEPIGTLGEHGLPVYPALWPQPPELRS